MISFSGYQGLSCFFPALVTLPPLGWQKTHKCLVISESPYSEQGIMPALYEACKTVVIIYFPSLTVSVVLRFFGACRVKIPHINHRFRNIMHRTGTGGLPFPGYELWLINKQSMVFHLIRIHMHYATSATPDVGWKVLFPECTSTWMTLPFHCR